MKRLNTRLTRHHFRRPLANRPGAIWVIPVKDTVTSEIFTDSYVCVKTTFDVNQKKWRWDWQLIDLSQ